MLRILLEKVDSMQGNMKIVRRQMETIKKNQKKCKLKALQANEEWLQWSQQQNQQA